MYIAAFQHLTSHGWKHASFFPSEVLAWLVNSSRFSLRTNLTINPSFLLLVPGNRWAIEMSCLSTVTPMSWPSSCVRFDGESKGNIGISEISRHFLLPSFTSPKPLGLICNEAVKNTWPRNDGLWRECSPTRPLLLCASSSSSFGHIFSNIQSTLSKTDTFGTGTSCPSYRESNRGSKERQGPTLGVRKERVDCRHDQGENGHARSVERDGSQKIHLSLMAACEPSATADAKMLLAVVGITAGASRHQRLKTEPTRKLEGGRGWRLSQLWRDYHLLYYCFVTAVSLWPLLAANSN